MQTWDVVIVGAGPAGSSAALSARRENPQARVLLLDAATFPRDKVCGDGIAPQAFDVLEALGVDLGALVAGTRPIDRLRLRSPGGVEAAREFDRPAAVVPRRLLDARLVDAALATGVRLQQHRVRTVEFEPDAVVLDGEFRARTVIAADGTESVLRRQVGAGAPRQGTVAVALRGYAPADAWPAGEQLLVMSRSHWPAYAWVFPVGDGTANVGYGELLQDAPPTRAHLSARLHALLPELGEVPLRGHRLPLTTGRPTLGQGRVLLAGDAASLINPLTGEGIYYAVLSGMRAGKAAAADDPAAAYIDAMRRVLGAHLRETDLAARLARRPGFLDLGVGAAGRSQGCFDDLVEIGLGAGRITPRLGAGLVREAARRVLPVRSA